MSEYIVIVPKGRFNHLQWNTTPSQHQDQTNSWALHAQECTHVNDTAFLLCPDLKQNRTTDPPACPDFQARRANKPFIFFFNPKVATDILAKLRFLLNWKIQVKNTQD